MYLKICTLHSKSKSSTLFAACLPLNLLFLLFFMHLNYSTYHRHFIKAFGPIYTSEVCFCCWLLTSKNVSALLFFFWLAYRKINNNFLRVSEFLIELTTLYLTCYRLWKHQVYIVGCILSWIIVARNCLFAFQHWNTVSVDYFLLSIHKYIRVDLVKWKLQVVRFF